MMVSRLVRSSFCQIRVLLTAVAGLLLLAPGLCQAVALELVHNEWIKHSDNVCQPKIWVPDGWDFWNGHWRCLQSNEGRSSWTQADTAAFEITGYSGVGTTVAGDSWNLQQITQLWQVRLAGASGEQEDVWLYADAQGDYSVTVVGLASAWSRVSAALRIWQGDFDGWVLGAGQRYFPYTGSADSDWEIEPAFQFGESGNLSRVIAGWPDRTMDEYFHDLLGLAMTVGDSTTDLWIATNFRLDVDAFAGTGSSGAGANFETGERGFRYGLSLTPDPPATWSSRAVPEPGTLVLLGLGLAGLGLSRRRIAN